MAKVGDIFVATWGYEQTNADFWQVVGVTKSGVKVRKIKSKETWQGQSMTGSSMPIKNSFEGEAKLKKIYFYDEREMFRAGESYGSAEKWDGNPIAISGYG